MSEVHKKFLLKAQSLAYKNFGNTFPNPSVGCLIVKNNRNAQNEPTVDAFKDLACYGIIAQIVQNGKWGK